MSKKSSLEMSPKVRSWTDYARVYPQSVDRSDEFWARVAETQIEWKKPWSQVSDCDYSKGKVCWYPGAELNVSENCLDRHIRAGKGNQRALIWVGNEPGEERIFTFSELHQEVSRVCFALESLGVRKGDRVVLYLPNIPELAISVLACARMGVIHSVIFGGFSAQSIQNRIADCGAKLVITANGAFRGNKWVNLKENVDQAMQMGCPTVEKVIVFNRHPQKGYTPLRQDLDWEVWLKQANPKPREYPATAHSANDPLFILYTSGSTGKPKGVVHQMGGYLTYVSYSHELVFQPQAGDVYWCTADVGWITGHSYLIYGPLANGVTTLMYEGVPTYPDPGRFWQIVDQYQVSIFYSAPTAIRILASEGNTWLEKSTRNSIRILGSVGEPINPEAWNWYSKHVGRDQVPLVDTWWQTETGGILISALAGISPTRPGSASFPLPGIIPQILNDQGQPIQGTEAGSLVISRSWPGQMTGVYGDPNRFFETYFKQFPGHYSTGDGAHRDDEGFYWIIGRTDDVIKVSGHRLGTAEIEAACSTHSAVVESGAVGVPDAVTGECIVVYLVLKDSIHPSDSLSDSLKEELVAVVRKEVGPLATPKKFYWVPGLPKTRSGKIMRRILRKIATGEHETLGDISTLSDPSIVEHIVKVVHK